MKIGLVIYGSLDTLSGGYLYDRKLVEYLRAQGNTVEIISLPWRNYGAHLTDNFHFRLPRGLDLVIEDELNHPSLIAANTRPHFYPVISLVHHLRSSELRPRWQNDFYRLIEKRYLQSVDGFIFNSKSTQGVVNSLVGNGKSHMIAYPPTDRFGPAITEEEIRTRANQDGSLRILFLGNVIERKGLHTLLGALALGVRQDNVIPCELHVVGSLNSEPQYAKEMQAKAEALGLKSKVFFYGLLDHEPLIERFKRAHVLVVPSSYEGFGVAYLEGMCFGLPAIGTTVGAASEIITAGVNGYLIEPDDSQTLAACLALLAQDRDLLVRMSVSALKRYWAQPKWDQTAKNIQDFLHAMTI